MMLQALMRKSLLLCGALAGIVFVPIYARAEGFAEQAGASGWRAVATEQDRLRVRGWRQSWVEGLRAATSENGAAVAVEGALLEPDAALLNPAPPVGDYRCRTMKLGASGSGAVNWVSYPEFRCRVTEQGGALTFAKVGGSQRPNGRLYPDGVRRMIFLGTLQLGDERQILRYGSDSQRDLAGILERVGDNRWRLVFPRPAFESVIDVVELVPAG
ncbi:MAG TPA: DUF4893 domain-containing protein [Allosphingosinicella sp.]|nr:DUF4893 domain-containing protein [Allosphingosinicella sp.]